jgi:site-specific DNA recombinase
LKEKAMKVAIYARVSSEAQDVDLSISAQLRALREYAQENGYIIVKEFVDEAFTGRTSARPAFLQMISMTKNPDKPFDAILVWKLSRFARSREDSIVYKTKLKKKDIQVISITEHFDDSSTGKLMEAIIESFDEYYSNNLGDDVTRGMRESVSRGFYLSARAPYGYRKVRVMDGVKQRTRLEVEPAQANTVKFIFSMIHDGMGLTEVVKEINSRGIPGPRRNGWNKTGLYTILTNEVYIGTFTWGRKSIRGLDPLKIKNACTAIVSVDDFKAVQAIMHERAFVMNHPKRTASRFLLSGLAKCGHCGKALVGQDAKSGRFSYYVCGTLNKKGAGSCPAPYLNSKKLELLVINKIKNHILTEDNLTRLVNLVNEETDTASTTYKDECDTILCELDDVRKRLGKLYDVIENNLELSYSDLAPRIRELRERQSKLEQRKAELEERTSQRKIEIVHEEVVHRYVEELHEFLNESSLVERKAFIKSFVREINVKDNEVKLRYTLPITQDGLSEENLGVLPIVRYGGPSCTKGKTPTVSVGGASGGTGIV